VTSHAKDAIHGIDLCNGNAQYDIVYPGIALKADIADEEPVTLAA
jgi:hypothetical protein